MWDGGWCMVDERRGAIECLTSTVHHPPSIGRRNHHLRRPNHAVVQLIARHRHGDHDSRRVFGASYLRYGLMDVRIEWLAKGLDPLAVVPGERRLQLLGHQLKALQ